MSLLVYTGYTSDPHRLFELEKDKIEESPLYKETCPYCKVPCYLDDYEACHPESNYYQYLAVCRLCGWWSWKSNTAFDGMYWTEDATSAILKEFAVDDPEVPYVELSKYIERNHDKLLNIAPSKCEELVANVYRDVFGYSVETCSYGRPDRGIDVVCVRVDSGEIIAIQVKRYRQPIKLGYIHQFFGAMVESRHKNGIFVTTSRFQKGCYKVADNLDDIAGVTIDLVDGKRFLEFLGLLNQKHNKVYVPVWGNFPLVFRDPTAPDPDPEECKWIDVSKR